MSLPMAIAAEIFSICLDVLFWGTAIYISLQAGLSSYIIDRYLSGKAAREATIVVFAHQILLAGAAWLLIRWFIWSPPDFIPALVAYPVAIVGLAYIIKVAKVSPRIQLFVYHAQLEARLTQDQAPT